MFFCPTERVVLIGRASERLHRGVDVIIPYHRPETAVDVHLQCSRSDFETSTAAG